MSRLKEIYLWIIVLSFVIAGPFAADIMKSEIVDTIHSLKDSAVSINSKNKNSFVLVPFANYTPETRIGGGFRFCLYHRPTPSNIYLNLFVSQNLQYEILLANELYKKECVFGSKFKASCYPDYFYKVGNSSSNESWAYSDFFVLGNTYLQKKIDRHQFGGQVEYRFENMLKTIPSNPFGNTDWNSFGIGPKYSFDSRNNIFYSNNGTYLNFGTMVFLPIGNFLSYNKTSFDYRYFRKLGPQQIIAIYTSIASTFGSIPFQVMPSVGDDLRGYVQSRYRDKNSFIIQSEYRFPLFWRIRGTLFGGAGDVYHQVSNLNISSLKIAGGAGLRCRINNNGVNLRIDYAINRKKEGLLYLNIGEAF
jgi:outer membrane protein assembly factor BamA